VEVLKGYKKYIAVFIGLSVLVITYFHYSTLPGIQELHNIFTELYYLPLILAALVFGFRGALAAFIAVSVLYLPYIVESWSGGYLSFANKMIHALFSGSLTMLAGVLVDREKRFSLKAEKDHYLASLGRASAAIVHDLRSPLIVIEGYTRRIRDGKGDIDEKTGIILDAVHRMQTIISDVLDFTKPPRLDLCNEDIRSIVAQVCEESESGAGSKEVDISVELPDAAVVVLAERSKLARAMVNLVNNAVDASLIGGKISVSLAATNGMASLRIRDYGAGMDRETIENIFIPFFTKKSSGTGLGMAISKQIIEAHNGRIAINSRKNVGTEVVVHLPLVNNQ
jgi:signal transduction histidine kinase